MLAVISLVTCGGLVKALAHLNYERCVLIWEEVRIVHVNHSLNLEKVPMGERPQSDSIPHTKENGKNGPTIKSLLPLANFL